MPKRQARNKNFRPRSETPRPYGQHTPFNVKDLLAKAGITTKGIASFNAEQKRWNSALQAVLTPDLLSKVSGTGFERGMLTVYIESAVWAARLRFALAESLPRLQQSAPDLKGTRLRLRPRASKAAGPEA